MLLKDMCTVDVVTAGAKSTVADAARLMRQKHVGDIVVVAESEGGGMPIGIVTDRDIAIEVVAKGLDAATTQLSTLIHPPVVIAEDNEDTTTVITRMRAHGVRRVPVVDRHGNVVGIVTLDDFLALLVADAGALLDTMKTGRQHEQRIRR